MSDFDDIGIRDDPGAGAFPKPPPEVKTDMMSGMILELAEELDKTNERLAELERRIDSNIPGFGMSK